MPMPRLNPDTKVTDLDLMQIVIRQLASMARKFRVEIKSDSQAGSGHCNAGDQYHEPYDLFKQSKGSLPWHVPSAVHHTIGSEVLEIGNHACYGDDAVFGQL